MKAKALNDNSERTHLKSETMSVEYAKVNIEERCAEKGV